MDYYEAIRFFYSLADFERSGRFASRTDVSTMLALLEELGNPHLGRVTVHVAGSKGKGSVCAMVEAMLRAAGLNTGLTTSPHLHRITERIAIDGQPISQEEFAAGADVVRAAVEKVQAQLPPERQIVTFDALTALAFYVFREHGVHVQVIEVGLGGLLDSTNVFETKDCAVITNIGLEHREILGDTVAEIARQKAGIIVPGCPTIMAPQRESAAEVIREVAQEKGSPLTEVALACNLRRDSAGSEAQTFKLRTPTAAHTIKLPLLGKHQMDNAVTAICAVEALAKSGVVVGPEAIKAGLETVKWPARIEVVKRRPMVIVDSAHTADSARRLRDTLEEYLHVRGATLVVGVMGDKDLEGLASAIEPVARRVIATQAQHPRALDMRSVGRAFQDLGIEVMYDQQLGSAIDTAMNLITPSEAVVILGSIALAGEARAYILGLEHDPPMTS
jgi:dihydrofolate synthase/folylpolyglutamate synthase